MQMTETNLDDSTSHEYEALDKYTEYEDIAETNFAKCPAYMPTVQVKT